MDVHQLHSTDASLPYIQPPEEEGNAETLFPEGCDRTSREDMQAEDRGRMEVLRDTKEIEEDDGRTGTTYCLKLKELRISHERI